MKATESLRRIKNKWVVWLSVYDKVVFSGTKRECEEYLNCPF